MNLLAALRSAWRALSANALRSTLTTLGIVIGVAAFMATSAIGRGATERVQQQMAALGSNMLLVLPGTRTANGVRLRADAGQGLTEDDAEAIAREVPGVRVAAPSSRSGMQAVAGGSNWATSVLGTTSDYLVARDWPLAAGRAFEPSEQARGAKVAIVGTTLARELFGATDPIDQVVRVRQVPMTVVGVLAPKGQNAFGQDQDDVLMVPVSTYRNRLAGSRSGVRRVGAISVKVTEESRMGEVEQGIRDLLRQRWRLEADENDAFNLRNLTELLRAREASSQVMTVLLSTVAGVSLLVGGIGIMNIMLVSVTERTREIGLRLAVGARQRDILLQFLIEAVALSLLGGVLGIVLGLLASVLMGQLTGWQMPIDPGSVFTAVGFSALVGVFFGFYPARRAARLTPMQALRSE